jgi:hypothetical protein
MRFAAVLAPLVAVLALWTAPPPVSARPEFARREGRACGYCHINPRGGGARNQRGIAYARNEFKFPPRKGDLTVFVRDRDRKAMVHARKMIHIDHVPAAVAELKRLAKSAKGEPARRAARAALHELDVRGSEVLGASRRLLRKGEADESVELLLVVVSAYKGLDVHAQATADLAELKREKEHRARIKKEEREAKARLVLLDLMRHEADGKKAKADKAFERLQEAFADTRAAKDARKRREKPKAGEGKK